MTKYLKPTAFLGVLISGLLLVAQSQAAIVSSIGEWKNATVTDQDKLYTYKDSTNLTDNIPVTFNFFPEGGLDVHTVTLTDGAHALEEGTYTLHYTIDIINAPPPVFWQASLGADVTGQLDVVTVFKEITDENLTTLVTLTSVAGKKDGPKLIPGDRIFIDVFERITVGAGGVVFSTTDTYTERVVPEPASIAIWAVLAGLGVGLAWWRRRRTS